MRKIVLISLLLLFKNGFCQSARPPARHGAVVINEIFADPSPSAGLPEVEFVELWNTTGTTILLNGWKYSDPSASFTFGNDTLSPGEYLILCPKASEMLFTPFDQTIGLKTWPVLNNDGDLLRLTDNKGEVIDEVAYKDSWYKDALKKPGGYSLERIDPANVCSGIQNWQAGNNGLGGTPGHQNSVYKSQMSTIPPRLIAAVMPDSVTIRLSFSKYLDSTSAASPANYSINNGLGNPIGAVPESPGFTEVVLKLNTGIIRGVRYYLSVGGLIDCAGNPIDPQTSRVEIFLADKIRPGDLLISEVLFNPRPGGVDFVEIYNASGHVLDLRDLGVKNADQPTVIKNVTSTTTYMQPGSYWVLTSDPGKVMAGYYVENPDNFIRISLPAYKVTSGSVILASDGQITDRFDYTEGMHTPLLKEAKGVSLERQNFEQDNNEAGNFTSASATAGYATPTYKNSVPGLDFPDDGIFLASKLFSPDNDGVADLLEIRYNFKSPGKMGSLAIYDDKGLPMRRLIKNYNLGSAGKLTWDGLNDNGQLCQVGIYVLVFDVFDLKGNIHQYKKACILAAKLK